MRNPGSSTIIFPKASNISPAATSSTSDIAICPTTSVCRPKMRRRRGTPTSVRLSAETRSARPACQAGARPKANALSTATMPLKTRTRPSIWTAMTIGVSVGMRIDPRYRTAAKARATPASPAGDARPPGSRPATGAPAGTAPRRWRAGSRSRATAREPSTERDWRRSRRRSPAPGRTGRAAAPCSASAPAPARSAARLQTAGLAPRRRLVSGYCSSSPRASDARSACACARCDPGKSRARTMNPSSSRRSSTLAATPSALRLAQLFPEGRRHVEERLNDWVHPGEGARGDADDGDGGLAHLYRAADHLGIAVELGLPETEAENRDRALAGNLRLLGQKTAAENRFDAQDLKEVAAHLHAHAHLRHRVGTLRKRQHGQPVRDQRCEGSIPLAEVLEVGVGDPAERRFRTCRTNGDEAVGDRGRPAAGTRARRRG